MSQKFEIKKFNLSCIGYIWGSTVRRTSSGNMRDAILKTGDESDVPVT